MSINAIVKIEREAYTKDICSASRIYLPDTSAVRLRFPRWPR